MSIRRLSDEETEKILGRICADENHDIPSEAEQPTEDGLYEYHCPTCDQKSWWPVGKAAMRIGLAPMFLSTEGELVPG